MLLPTMNPVPFPGVFYDAVMDEAAYRALPRMQRDLIEKIGIVSDKGREAHF